MTMPAPAFALPLSSDASIARGDAPVTAPRRTDFEALHHLQKLTLAAVDGFSAMVDKAEPEFRPVAGRFLDLHRTHAADLTAILADLGFEPAEDGGLMGLVNRAVVTVRALVDEVDEDTISSIRDGEEHILDAFADALEAPVSIAYAEEVAAMRQELADLLAETTVLD